MMEGDVGGGVSRSLGERECGEQKKEEEGAH
jgi:hypothetical protein